MSGDPFEERFIKLVEENGGFEYCQAYRNDVDLILGGKNGTYRFVSMKKGKVKESYIGKFNGSAWEDVYVKGRNDDKKTKAAPSGSTIKMIAEKAYLCQNETWVTRRTPKPVEDDHPRYHYVYGFGDKGLDVSVQYGVTIAYNDIKDPDVGFHLRYLYTGKDVEIP